jgi:poly(A) polymerase
MNAEEAAKEVAQRLTNAGFIAYLAGGCVRDRLLGLEPKDYDVATSATPEQVLDLFPKGNEIGAHFGVILVRHGGQMIEVATFRTDGCYQDGRRPDHVIFATPEADAQRRDFSINGLFENPLTGEIIDGVGGRDDLAAGIIRAIGDPGQRFREDSLRLMRGVRFACSLGFSIDPATHALLCECAPLLERIAPERIREELCRMLVHPSRSRAFVLLAQTKLFASFWPEVMALIGCDQPPEWHPEGDVFEHTRIMLEMLPDHASLELCLAVLLHDIGKPPTRTIDASANNRIRFNGHDAVGAEMAEDMLRRLRFSNEIIDAVVPMVARHMQFMNVQQMRTAKLKRFMSSDRFSEELELHRVDCASSNGFTDNWHFLQQKREEFSHAPLIPAPLVNGRDLIAAGLKPGRLFAEILETIQTEQLEGRLQNREQALAFFQKNWLKKNATD